MSYTKTNWVEDGSTPINETRLNNLETQYDESIADAEALRKDSTKELRVESTTASGETATEGRLIFDNGVLYGADGSAFSILSHKRKQLFFGGQEEVAIDGGTTFDHMIYILASGSSSESYAVTNTSIDLTPYSKVGIVWECIEYESQGGSASGSLVASTTKNATKDTYDARVLRLAPFYGNQGKVDILDVSSLSGNYYIRVHSFNYNSGSDTAITIYGIWLEV